MGFHLHSAVRHDLLPQVDTIARSYFTIDTASPELAGMWYRKNPSCLIIATIDDVVHGYADFLPLTSEAKQLIEERRLKEEEIGPNHILEPEAMPFCRAVYFAGIAVRDRKSLLAMRCAAALVAGCAYMIEHVYSKQYLEFFYTNPTTYTGNRLVRRLGLQPISAHKKTTSGMDLYMAAMNDAMHHEMNDLSTRYGRFISSMEWSSDQS